MSPFSFELSAGVLLYLGSVAAASLVVTGAALAFAGVWRTAALPLRHAVLVGGMLISVLSPLVLAAMWISGVSAFQLPLERDFSFASAAEPSATTQAQEARPIAVAAAATATSPEPQHAQQTGDFAPGLNTLAPTTIDEFSPTGLKAWSWIEAARVAVMVWGAGSLASLLALSIGLVRVRRLRSRCRPLAEARITRLTAEAARELGMNAVPAVFVSSQVDAPVSLGIGRPCVVVPEGVVDSLDDAQLRGLLWHELAHVARRDHLVGLLQRIAHVLYWWNPLVRRASGQIATLREEICDDLATHRDASGDGYAAMLVELASRALCRRSLPTAIGMFDGSRGEFSRRVERLLEEGRARVTALDGRMKLVSGAMCMVLLAAVCLTSVRLEANAEEAKAQAASEMPPVNWPKVLRGYIRDEQGKPVAGAKVRLDLEKIDEFKTGRWKEMLVSQEMMTGADGEYRFDAADYPEMKHRPFSLTMSVTADGYADAKAWNWHTRRDTKVDEKWFDVQMWAGRVVRGRVTSPGGIPIAGAVIKAAGDFGMDHYTQNWAWNPRKSDEDGKFSFSVPDRDGPVELWVVSRKWAPQRVVLPKRGDEIADVRLQDGGRVSGRVTLEDGSPVAGAVVAAESIDDGTLDGMTFPVRLAAKTDNDGRYELPPLLGIYKLYLTQALESDDRLLGRFIVANGPPPLTLPQRVAVVSGGTQSVDFQGGKGLIVNGTVRWADGRPVADCEAEASYLAPGNGTGITLDATHTDAEGRYTIRLPKPIDHVSINIIGAYDAKQVWHYAMPTDNAPVKRKQLQFANLNPLSEDLAGVDWVLKRREDIPEMQPVAEVTKTPAAEELAKLQRRYELRQQELREALEQAKTLEERAKLQLTLDPRVLMADEYLAFEEEHRSTDSGLAALVKLNGMAATVSHLMPKLPEARRELYHRLGEHYLEHPDLDLVFANVSAGPQSPAGPDLLTKAMNESPHKSVQAAAIYQLACFHVDLAEDASSAAILIAEVESHQPQDRARLEFMRQAAAKLKEVDPAAEQEEALELARRLNDQYADVREPQRISNESGMFWRRPAGIGALKPTYGALAQGLIFDLEKLQVGLPAPDIATENDGKQEYATQYLGKVTVIVFDHSFNESQERKIAAWAKSQAGKPLDVLVVRGRFEGEPDEVDGSALAPLRFVVEDDNGPLGTQWSIRRRPTVFVVDGNGVIRGRRLNELPYHLVNELLKGAASETDRGFFDGQRAFER